VHNPIIDFITLNKLDIPVMDFINLIEA